jgi:hypothetical protein
MKVIDTERSWMDGAKVYPKGVEFEADERLMNLISKQSDTFYEVAFPPLESKPDPAPDPLADASSGDADEEVETKTEDVEKDADAEGEGSQDEKDEDADVKADDAPPPHNLTATYSGGGWYELSNGESLRRKDLPVGTVVKK